MNYEKRKRYIVDAAYAAITIALVVFVFRYAIFWLMPFVVAFGVAFLLKPSINSITRLLHLRRKPVAALVVLLFYGTAGVLLFVGLFQLTAAVRSMIFNLPEFYEVQVLPALNLISGNLMQAVQNWEPQSVQQIEALAQTVVGELSGLVATLSTALISIASQMALSVPALLISILFTVISSFFIAMDYYRITTFLVGQFSEKNQNIIMEAKNYVVNTVFRMITSYALIMFITFTELAAGFWILGLENPVGKAACIALVDVLPVLGTGGVMVPWILFSLLMREYSLAVGLLAIYLFVTVVRNVIEPKIVGNRVGLHPVVMLICMFIGVTLFGPLGIVVMPFLVIVIKNLNDTGRIHVYKNTDRPRPSWEAQQERFTQAADEAKQELCQAQELEAALREAVRRELLMRDLNYPAAGAAAPEDAERR